MTKTKTVYPVPSTYLRDRPHVEHDCSDPFCVESGAFTHDPPPKAKTATPDPADAGSLDSDSVEA